MLYLLHIKSSDAEPEHYIGTCGAGRLLPRMQEHVRSSTAPLVKRLMESGASFRVARVWLQGSYAAERDLKTTYRPRDLCPICCGGRLDTIGEAMGEFRKPSISPAQQRLQQVGAI